MKLNLLIPSPVVSAFLLVFVTVASCQTSSRKATQPIEEVKLPQADTVLEIDPVQLAEVQKKNISNSSSIQQIEFKEVPNVYHEDSSYHISRYLTEITPDVFLEVKNRQLNLLDTSELILPIDHVISIPTQTGKKQYEIHTFEEYGYEGVEYKYVGYCPNVKAHILSVSFAEGFGYRMVFEDTGKEIVLMEFPYLSNDNQLIVTCRIDGENIVMGSLELKSTNPEEPDELWAAWSDYTFLPIEAVWETDSTFLVKAEEYESEAAYYEREKPVYKYGRLSIKLPSAYEVKHQVNTDNTKHAKDRTFNHVQALTLPTCEGVLDAHINFDKTFCYQNIKIAVGYYKPIEGQMSAFDSELDYGWRLFLYDAQNQLITKSKGAMGTYSFKPLFYTLAESEDLLCVVQMASEYDDGLVLYLLNSNDLRYIGDIDEVGTTDENLYLSEVLEINQQSESLVFTFNTEKLLYWEEGKGDDMDEVNSCDVSYVYENGKFRFVSAF